MAVDGRVRTIPWAGTEIPDSATSVGNGSTRRRFSSDDHQMTLISPDDLADMTGMDQKLNSRADSGNPRVRAILSGFKSNRLFGTECRDFRRISDKDACRYLPFWATRKNH